MSIDEARRSGSCSRRAVGRDADAVVEIGDRVVGDDVARAVDLDGVVARQRVRAVRAGAGPQRAGPADQAEAIVAAEEEVVGDVEVARAGVLGPDAEADVLEAAVLDRQADRARAPPSGRRRCATSVLRIVRPSKM